MVSFNVIVERLPPPLSKLILVPKVFHFDFLLVLAVFIAYFVFIIMKINKEKIDPDGYMYFVIDSVFSYIFLPIFHVIIMFVWAMATSQSAGLR
jgi:hypothetical protein